MIPKLRSGLVVYFWLRVSHATASDVNVGYSPLKDWLGGRIHHQGGSLTNQMVVKLMLALGWESRFCTGASPQSCLGVLIAWRLASSWVNDWREQNGRYNVFYDLVSAVTHHHFHCILFVLQSNPDSMWAETILGHIPWGKDHWGSSRRLTITSELRILSCSRWKMLEKEPGVCALLEHQILTMSERSNAVY